MLEKLSETTALHYASLLEVSALIASGDVSPLTVTERMLERIAAVDPGINSYLSVTADSALSEARAAKAEIDSGRHRGPLHGVPIAIKDLFHTKGVPSTFGSVAYKDFVSDKDATIVHRLRMSGAVILGRLHLHEGAYGEHHPALPRCNNPWNGDYWPGGSSSGSGAATAAGLCYGSLGTDTGGSIRFPSAANGVTGLKVTWGRTSRYGVHALADSLDTIGPIAPPCSRPLPDPIRWTPPASWRRFPTIWRRSTACSAPAASASASTRPTSRPASTARPSRPSATSSRRSALWAPPSYR
jgi:amidase